MRTKVVLLQSVSAIATLAATNGQALAQVIQPATNGYTFNVGGGLLLSPAEMSLAGLEEDKMGSGFDTDLSDFQDHLGYNAFFSVGKQIDNNWDVRLGGSVNQLLDSTASLSFSGIVSGSGGSGLSFSSYSLDANGTYNARSAFGFETMDFEVGYAPVLTDTTSVRLFAGIRGLHFAGERDTHADISGFSSSFYDSGLGSGSGFNNTYFNVTSDSRMKTEFFGAGPRLGVSAAHRFEGTNFGVSGTVAGSVLFGQQTTTWSAASTISGTTTYFDSSGGSGSGSIGDTNSSFTDSLSFSSSYSTSKMVVDLEAKAGFDYYLDDSSALTIGYRAEKLLNVGPYDDNDEERLVHGPFVSLTGGF
ncbi:MAG: hypothetical protein JWQ89_3290 [Devosia sp.]|uniref:Lpg1974 family pore-forming outer membrane protein n=1 Tax=Devosia sp. TaxID=1871048 RepID=UPI00262130FD|nr:Lpg1974 family pore-forming outer membrane protein [Devosia sp.]MDB5541563.1 hypothetical protein [Devosia sp.]